MLDRKKENNAVCSLIRLPSNFVNNAFASVHYLDINIKLLFLKYQYKATAAGGGRGAFLGGGENLRRSDFEDLKTFQS